MKVDDPMREHRAARLQEFLERYCTGTEAERHRDFLSKVRRTKGWLSQVRKGLGYQAAIETAHSLGLPDPGWFDRPIGTPKLAQPPDLSGVRQAEPLANERAVKSHEPSAPIGIEDAVRVIAEALLTTPEEHRDAASSAVRVLASAPKHWREVAEILRGDDGPPLGGSFEFRGSGRQERDAG
jgi:hypothetical protein